MKSADLHDYLAASNPTRQGLIPGFNSTCSSPERDTILIGGMEITRYQGEFWTAKQRQANPLHEIAYRACFKAQLPAFFIDLVTEPEDRVYDPFSGRGTTVIEAALRGRNIVANDANPLSAILARPRLMPPDLRELERRLSEIPFDGSAHADLDLSMFFHPRTEASIFSLRSYLQEKHMTGSEDDLDSWIRMVATNRLTGHSPGFFSVYTLPPNQAASAESQVKINVQRKQTPPFRDVPSIILKKSTSLMKGLSSVQMQNLRNAAKSAIFLVNDARSTPDIQSNTVQLTVTSPPFLNVVQYAKDNWLRCWFNALDPDAAAAAITMTSSSATWTEIMEEVLSELLRITKPGGYVAFEVGEVAKGTLNLDELIAPAALRVGFACEAVIINQQRFTKTANIWGVDNNTRGTNSNRIVLLRKK